MGDAWFQTGYEVPEEAKQLRNLDPTKWLRFFVEKGGSKKLVLLDDEPFCFFEHHPVVGNVYDLYFTCVKGIPGYDDCVGCEGDDRRYWVGMLSCLDLTKFKKRDGTEIHWKRQVIPFKAKSLELMKRQKDKRGSLVFARYEVFRGTGQQSPRVGDNWDFEEIMTREKLLASLPGLKEEDLQPFNYAELFKPKTVDEMRMLMRGQRLGEGVPITDGEVDAAAEADDIPF